MEIEEIIESIRKVLDEKDSLREEALKVTREIVRLSGDAVKAVHRNDLNLAEERLSEAGKEWNC